MAMATVEEEKADPLPMIWGKPRTKARQSWDSFFKPKASSDDELVEDLSPIEDYARRRPGGHRYEDQVFLSRRGRRGYYRVRDDSPDDDERVSHILSRILRYRLECLELPVDADGYVAVSDILRLPELKGASLEDVERVALNSIGVRGRRFELIELEEGLRIRALYKNGQTFGSDGHRMRSSRRYLEQPWRGHRNGECRSLSGPEVSLPEQVQVKAAEPQRVAEENSQGGQDTTETAVASTESPTTAGGEGEAWERFLDNDSQRVWFWNESSQEAFFADDEASGWQQFQDPGGQTWWWHEASNRFFFEQPEK